MYDQNDYYLNMAVSLIAGDPDPTLPREFRDAMIDEEMLQDFALTLRNGYPNFVNRGIWSSMNLRGGIDMFLDESDPTVKHLVFGDRFFSESEREEILERCAALIRDRLQRYVNAQLRNCGTNLPLKVCYKVMPNGRVGYRLE